MKSHFPRPDEWLALAIVVSEGALWRCAHWLKRIRIVQRNGSGHDTRSAFTPQLLSFFDRRGLTAHHRLWSKVLEAQSKVQRSPER